MQENTNYTTNNQSANAAGQIAKPQPQQIAKPQTQTTPTKTTEKFKMKTTSSQIYNFVDENEKEKKTRRAFRIQDNLFEHFEKIVAAYPSKIDKDDLMNYLISNAEKIFGTFEK